MAEARIGSLLVVTGVLVLLTICISIVSRSRRRLDLFYANSEISEAGADIVSRVCVSPSGHRFSTNVLLANPGGATCVVNDGAITLVDPATCVPVPDQPDNDWVNPFGVAGGYVAGKGGNGTMALSGPKSVASQQACVVSFGPASDGNRSSEVAFDAAIKRAGGIMMSGTVDSARLLKTCGENLKQANGKIAQLQQQMQSAQQELQTCSSRLKSSEEQAAGNVAQLKQQMQSAQQNGQQAAGNVAQLQQQMQSAQKALQDCSSRLKSAEEQNGARGGEFEFKFTTCGATGPAGPTPDQMRNAYAAMSWARNMGMNSTGIQRFMVPMTGNYIIEAAGASGGCKSSTGGQGIVLSMSVYLTQSTILNILVGQVGGVHSPSSGGGGGTFVVRDGMDPVIVAGGGAGFHTTVANLAVSNAVNATNANNSSDGSGQGGSGGGGGKGSNNGWGGGGGGLTGDGTDAALAASYGYKGRGTSFQAGGAGGNTATSAWGGFGGGGGTHGNSGGGGGGGGYSGGGGCNQNQNPNSGGGGGSYGVNPCSVRGYNPGMGYVTITMMGRGGAYMFSSFTFSTCGATRHNGPTFAQMKSAYVGTAWTQDDANLRMTTQGIQLWTVPASGNYTIEAKGATAGSQGENGRYVGKPALMTGTFSFAQGQILRILVGQTGWDGSTRPGWGGGGGTFVAINNDPLIVAGGCGAAHTGLNGVSDASLTTLGRDSAGNALRQSDGDGGGASNGGSGAGFKGDGTVGNNSQFLPNYGGPITAPTAFVRGGLGSTGGGGFGGGGAVTNTYGGGGGGYSGGAGGNSPWPGGGGGSYNSGSNKSSSNAGNGVNMSNGYVTITRV